MTPREYLRRRERGLRRSLRARGASLVADADDRFDLSGRIRRHPWLALGAGALTGGILGNLTARVPGPGVLRGFASPLLRLASAAWDEAADPHGTADTTGTPTES